MSEERSSARRGAAFFVAVLLAVPADLMVSWVFEGKWLSLLPPVVLALAFMAAFVPGGYLRDETIAASRLAWIISLAGLIGFLGFSAWAAQSWSLERSLLAISCLWASCVSMLWRTLARSRPERAAFGSALLLIGVAMLTRTAASGLPKHYVLDWVAFLLSDLGILLMGVAYLRGRGQLLFGMACLILGAAGLTLAVSYLRDPTGGPGAVTNFLAIFLVTGVVYLREWHVLGRAETLMVGSALIVGALPVGVVGSETMMVGMDWSDHRQWGYLIFGLGTMLSGTAILVFGMAVLHWGGVYFRVAGQLGGLGLALIGVQELRVGENLLGVATLLLAVAVASFTTVSRRQRLRFEELAQRLRTYLMAPRKAGTDSGTEGPG